MDKIIEIHRKGGVAHVKFLSGEEMKIPSPLFLERRLREGEMMDPAAYRLFMQQRGYPHALEAAMKFLALRERSRGEIRSRLMRSCYDVDTIAKVLDTLSLHNLVSDARFAQAWTASRSRKYGKSRIALELKMKGVNREEAKAALDELTEEEELGRAVDQARKLSRRLQNEPDKMIQALIRRGYSWGMARKAVERVNEE